MYEVDPLALIREPKLRVIYGTKTLDHRSGSEGGLSGRIQTF